MRTGGSAEDLSDENGRGTADLSSAWHVINQLERSRGGSAGCSDAGDEVGNAVDAECASEAAESAASTNNACSSSGSVPPDQAAEAGSGLSCLLCLGLRGDPDEPLFRSPCRCPDGAFVHRSCVEEFQWLNGVTCRACGARYPTRRRTKPLWRWFWEQESRDDATLFAANLVFTAGNVGVLCMAWMYVLYEYRSRTWLPTSWLACALFVLTVFWVGFGCVRFYVVYTLYTRWRRANTTVKVLLADKSAAQA